jgi:hypothetical protein
MNGVSRLAHPPFPAALIVAAATASVAGVVLYRVELMPLAVLGLVVLVGPILVAAEVLALLAIVSRPLVAHLWQIEFLTIGTRPLSILEAWGIVGTGWALLYVVCYGARLRSALVPAAGLLASHLVALGFGAAPLESAQILLKTAGSLLFLAVGESAYRRSSDPARYTRAIAAALFIAAGVGAVSGLLLSSFDESSRLTGLVAGRDIIRSQGVFFDPFPIAVAVLCATPLAWGTLFWPELRSARQAGMLVLATGAAAIYGTFLRSAWLMLALHGVLAARYSRNRTLMLTLGILASAFPAYLLLSRILPFLSSFFVSFVALGQGSIPTWAFSGRWHLWTQFMSVFAGASPRQQLLGFGLGADRIITLGFDDPRVFGTSSHNDLVGVIIETGIVGAVFFVWLLAALGREILHMERMATDAHQLVLVRTATILWVTFILLGVTSRPLQYPSLSWPVLVVIGGVLGMRNRLDAHRN